MKAPGTNVVIVGGNLTRDAECGYTPGGTAKCTFSIGHNKRWKTRDGDWKQEKSFFDCILWGEHGERMAEKLKKGVPVLVQGELKQDSWEYEGVTKSKIEIVVRRVDVFESDAAKDEPNSTDPGPPGPVSDDDIPF